MAPKPQDPNLGAAVASGDGDRVVISGMSGLFPQCHNVKEFSELLYNKVNPITSEAKHWSYSHPEVAQYMGIVPELDRFDAQFFKVHFRLGNSMDSMSRKMLEQSYQAIYDAGLSPEHLSGKKIGVFVGSCFSETEKAAFYVATSRTGFGLVGCSKAMFANRISYWLNAKGPSVGVDEACCSSIAALEQGCQAISRGDCEAAIIGGANLCLHPQSSVHYSRIMKICLDGKTKVFDENADGVAKSEAISVLFLQKARDALRVYADVLQVKSVFMSHPQNKTATQFGFYRDPECLTKFLKSFYEEVNVPPEEIEYVEAFGAAVPDADKAELEAFGEVFCKNREDKLLVGSVMSNIGYGEAASGISSITKVLIGYQKGEIAANLHCSNPRKDVVALKEDRMRIVTEHKPFNRTYTAINNLSVTGCVAHVLLQGKHKPKDLSRYKSSIPHLVTISGRQESAVKKILNDLKSRPVDPEELALFHNIHSMNIPGHLGRGFTILHTNAEQKTVSLVEKCEYFDNARRPLWFVYSGMGSQWPAMGAHLMRIPVFAAAIERCQRALQPKGIDIVQIITSPNKDTFNNILHSFVGIAAVQIGLTDVMMQLGLVPDKIIGHSVGELGCAYADGCLTAEEMILSAYSRGLVSVQTPLIRGSMAAVGVGYEEMVNMIPPEIEVACHNSSESSTISGPADLMREFVASLTAKGIFAKEVPCSNIAYHSRYIADAGPGLLKYLTEVIKTPKLRSVRWISTSVPQNRWHEDLAKYSSAQYHTNNLLSPVLFEETSKLIPSDAVVVEIAPHGLLQAILKRSLPESCNNIPLTRRGHPDNALMVLEGIGKLFMEGYSPKLEVLYPKIEFPVSTGTPMLSHLVEWAHHEKWVLPLYVSAHRKTAAAAKFVVSVQDDECNYLQGHVVKGKNVYPFSAAVVAVWDTLAMSLGEQRKQISVEFRDLRFFSQPILHNQRQLRLNVTLHRGTGRFEVMDEDSKVITGYITPSSSYYFDINATTSQSEKMSLDSENIYEMFYQRECSYSGDFQNIHSANTSLTEAHLYWNNNWVTILDGMLQLNALKRKHGGVSQPAMIRRMCMDIQEHLLTEMVMMNGKPTMKACVSEMFDRTMCGGIVIENIKFNDLPLNYLKNVSMKALKFIPFFQSNQSDVQSTLLIYLQMAAENMNKDTLNIIEIRNTPEGSTTFNKIKYLMDEIPGLKLTYQQMCVGVKMQERRRLLDDVDLILVQNFSLDDTLFQMLYSTIQRDVFLVSAEKIPHEKLRTRPSTSCRIVASQNSGDTFLHLYRLNPKLVEMSTTSVTVRTQNDLNMLLTTRDKLPPNHKLIVLTSYPPLDGVKELVTLWRKDSIRNQINLMMVNHKIAKEQVLDQMPEMKLAFNILDHGTWGGEYYVPMVHEKSVVSEMKLQSEQIGNLDALCWVETPSVKSSGVTVTVHYAGLTSMDAKRALGLYPKMSDDNFNYNSYGMDFSGITDSGVQVMGLVRGGSASNRVSAVPELLWPVPKHWTLEDAATVPMAYVHAFYCLFIRSYFKPKGSILVHGGTGALGQAVISIALAYGLNVFTTVSDIRKKHFLRKLFPDLKEDHIGNSRDTSFRDMVINLTNGIGADCIINCVKGELKHMSLKAAATCGITLDTTQLQSNEVFSLGMSRLMHDRNYITVDFCSIFNESNYVEMKKLQLLVSEGIARGYVRPLSRVSYSPLESTRAFRLLEASQHRGRVLLKLADTPLTARPRLTCSSSHSHVIISDDESVGIQLADKMISCGAKKIILQMNRNPPHVLLKKQSWQNLGAEVKILTENIINKNINTLLNEGTKIAPIEGIYLVSTSAGSKTKQDILTALDVSTRNLCPQLKYFAVITTDKSFGNQVCISRAQDRLPATKLDLPSVKKMDAIEETTTDVGICARDVCDALEKALRSPHTLTLAHTHHGVKETLLQKIAALTNIKIPASVSTTSSLEELGISYEKSFAIATLLRNEHGLSLSEDQILSLNVRRIHEIEKITVGTEMREVKGFDVFYSHIDTDELIATTDMVFLPTLTSSATMRDDEFDVNQTYLCIVPGLEGHYERFRGLCERIKVPAIVLQPGLDRPNESIRQMAEKYTQILLRKAALKTNYYLVGYESGVMVALEMAAILEDQGLTGTVYCIGTAPDQFKLLLENELKFDSEEALQEALLRQIFNLMIEDDSSLEFEKHSTWQEKIETCIRALLGRVPHSAQYAKAQFETAYGRILQVHQYNPKPRLLKAKLVLLHTTTPGVQNQPITDAEFLQQYSQQPIAVHELNAPLAHVLKDLRCAAIINQYLDPDILDEFNMKNLCETYLFNADTFMSSGESSD